MFSLVSRGWRMRASGSAESGVMRVARARDSDTLPAPPLVPSPLLMTRYTSLAYKRTHFDAGFDDDEPHPEPEPVAKKPKTEEKKGWGRDESIKLNAAKSEERRQKRAQERLSSTICFACRGKGHAAKDCPDANLVNDNHKTESAPSMGICYRCGSTKHSLKRCKRPENPDNPLPFATCFVCSGKGHLAGSCQKNGKGVYPDGGSCVLCGKTTHLARDCDLRKQPVVDHAIMAAERAKANPDEDDFHVFKRKQMRVEKAIVAEDKQQQKKQQQQSSRPSKPIPSTSRPSKPKPKVVAF
ncbi:hypothetical protein EXIGLDRAFT_44485 [Exidia glandulosa HHB12029]|uniref:CCHC-type domain-containing protein n=1 Tax=Exidia glandulosa HHB12029 TaxID=1314781 RepID=A0A165IHH1_EXIGL|nr:hypothetical protein EXIGLDRAFT_44485 [Exidia glandulosa HHB12029]